MDDTQLPVDVLHWIAALVPLAVLLLLLVVLRWKAPEAGPIGMFTAAAIALLLFRTPFETLIVGGARGVWDALFILFVVWPALLLYRVVERAGAFAALRNGIERYTRNELFLVMGFAWVFASFLQGIAGFGAPIAVVAPLLVALGVRPLFAVALPLIGHAWANMFGTLAVGWLATLRVVELEDPTRVAFETAILLWIPSIAAGFSIAWLYGRGAAVRAALPMILVIATVHGGGQLLLTLWDPVLSTFIASSIALLLLYPLSRWKRYSEPAEGIERRPAMKDEDADATARARDEEIEHEGEPVMSLPMALLPYAVLTVISIAALVPDRVEEALGGVEVGLAFPEVSTNYGLVTEAEDPYSPFAPFTHPGTFLLLSAIVVWIVYRTKGYYEAYAERRDREAGLLASLADDAVPASVAIVGFLVMSTVMEASGQTAVLAQGIAEVAPPTIFAFLSTWIGVLGAFMTSSNTASNILFAPLQQDTVVALEGLRQPPIIGAQSTGGAIGNAIAPANVVLGTGTAGNVGEEGEILRRTLPWTIGVAVLVGLATVALNAW
ncbi:MAG TPA: L-lactate permease [Actinomycetota bacterium]|nr:L-lactate permease [Actinomycetota bacterium]